MKSLSEIRKEYTKSHLDITTVNPDPILQFNSWLEEAASSEALEPTAMNLATISEAGTPTSRIVLLKGVTNGKFLFYSNHLSQKGKALAANPACALTFFWPELERQVRIEGMAELVDTKTSETYFQSRPRSSQVGAWSSPQSAVISSREILEERVKKIEKRFEGVDKLPKPNQWGGYGVLPVIIEFWQGRRSRLHDRILYTKDKQEWKVSRLAP